MKFNQARILCISSLLLLSPYLLDAQDTPAKPAQSARQEALKREKLTIAANQAISDGQRFLVNRPVRADTPPIVVLSNWNRAKP